MALLVRAKVIVKGPTRPANIVIMITAFPKVLKFRVQPSVSPTIPKAEVDSKNNVMKSASSDIDSSMVTITTDSS